MAADGSRIADLAINGGVALIMVVAGFWYLADPSGAIRDIRSTFLTIREHDEFVVRFNKDIARIEESQKEQNTLFETRINALATQAAQREVVLRLEEQIRDLRRDAVTRKELDGYVAVLNRIETQMSQFATKEQLALHSERDKDSLLVHADRDKEVTENIRKAIADIRSQLEYRARLLPQLQMQPQPQPAK